MRKIFTILFIVGWNIVTYSQDSISLPGGYKMTSMADFTNFPIGNPTGLPAIDLPLYSVKTQGSLTLDLKLLYNHQGSNNPKLVSNQFGDAWNLNIAGTITRESYRLNAPAGGLHSYLRIDEKALHAVSNSDNDDGDVYTFNVLGLSGKFFIQKHNNTYTAKFLEANDWADIEITPPVSSNDFFQFVIKNKKGIKYEFRISGNTNKNKYYYYKTTPPENLISDSRGNEYYSAGYPVIYPGEDSDGDGVHDDNPFDPQTILYVHQGDGPDFNTQWFLTKITDKYNNVLADFTYQPFSAKDILNTYYLSGINITNRGKIELVNNVEPHSGKTITHFYTNQINIKDVNNNLISTIGLSYEDVKISRSYAPNSTTGTGGYSAVFHKNYLTKVKHTATGGDYDQTEVIYNKNVFTSSCDLYRSGAIKPAVHNSYDEYKKVFTFMNVKDIVGSTGGKTSYEFEPNTISENKPIDFYKDYFLNRSINSSTPVYNATTGAFTFTVASGTTKLLMKVNGTNETDNSGGGLGDVGGGPINPGNPFEPAEFQLKIYRGTTLKATYDMTDVVNSADCQSCYQYTIPSGEYGTYKIVLTPTPDIASAKIHAITVAPENNLKLYTIARGSSRLKKLGYYENRTATTPELEFTFSYEGIDDARKSSGSLAHASMSQAATYLYGRVNVQNADRGSTEYFYNNVSLQDEEWKHKNQRPKRIKTYSKTGQLLDDKSFERLYQSRDIGNFYYQQDGALEPLVTKETVHTKTYEGTSFTEQSNEVNYDLIHRYPTEVISTLPAISETLKQTNTYSQLGGVFVKTASEGFLNGNKVSASAYHYNSQGDLLYTETAKSTLPLEQTGNEITRITNGRVEEYKQPDGTYVSRIWGYNDTEVVAELKNLRYTQIASGTITNIKNSSKLSGYNETALTTALNSLRTAHPTALITTYVYTPMVGMKSSTDANGRKETYQYDTFNRLYRVLNHEGNVVKEYNYNIKN